jgi:hypothetical protein
VQYRGVLDGIVDSLLEKETVEKEELAELLAPVSKRPARDMDGYEPSPNGARRKVAAKKATVRKRPTK